MYLSPRIGSVSHGTLIPADLAEAFYHEADAIGGHIDFGSLEARNSWWDRLGEIGDTLYPHDDGSMCDDEETVSECVDELQDLLSEIAPPYMYFGAHEGDGSDFGFWPDWNSLEELPKYDEIPDTLPDDDFVVINDHGNVSVYGADGKLIWDCV